MSYLRDGKQSHYENVVKVVAPDLAFIVGFEWVKAWLAKSDLSR
jgi:hypothetical protein